VKPFDGRAEHDGEEGSDEQKGFDASQGDDEPDADQGGQHQADGDDDRPYRHWIGLVEHPLMVRRGARRVALSSPLPWGSPSPSRRSAAAATTWCASSSTAASPGWDTSAIGPARTSSETARPTSWLGACSPEAASKVCTSIRMW